MTVKLSINNIKKYSLSIQSMQVVYQPRDVYIHLLGRYKLVWTS